MVIDSRPAKATGGKSFYDLIDQLPGWRARQAMRRAYAQLPWGSLRIYTEPYTLLSRPRLKGLEWAIRHVANIPGDVVECGTAAGGSALLLALWLRKLNSPKTLYLLDTFDGLPPPSENDPDREKAMQWTGRCRGTVEEIEALFEKFKVLDRAVLVKGLYAQTLPKLRKPRSIALLHLDCDWYNSVNTCLDYLWDRIPPGGVLQIDDYGSWEGCRKAVDEFFAAHGIDPNFRVLDYQGRQVIKTSAKSFNPSD